MTAPTLAAVMAGIEARLATISGLNVSDVSPGQVLPPQAIVGVPPIGDYLSALAGRRPVLAPTVTVLTGAQADRVGQLQLAAYADPDGPSSIPAAIAADITLGGLVGHCQVVSFQPLGLQEVGMIGYFGGVFTCRVTT